MNPLSNCFFQDIEEVWKQCARILRPGGVLIYAFNNPICYQFDYEQANIGNFQLKYAQPYSDLTSLSGMEKKTFFKKGISLRIWPHYGTTNWSAFKTWLCCN